VLKMRRFYRNKTQVNNFQPFIDINNYPSKWWVSAFSLENLEENYNFGDLGCVSNTVSTDSR
jgi:hypothetical protein